MTKRDPLGGVGSGLDALLDTEPRPRVSRPATSRPAPPAASREPRPASRATPRARHNIFVDAALLDAVKDAVYWTHGQNLTRFTEEALREKLERMERERGEQFPPREAPLRTGRPMR